MYRATDQRGVVVLNSAMAVPRGFYGRFCEQLAGSGISVVTYDYRGIGGSWQGSLRGSNITMSDWIFSDMEGVLAWTCSAFGVDHVGMVGHSFGGQVPGLLKDAQRIKSVVTISAQSGYWRLQAGISRPTVALHVHVTLPLLAGLFGYVPWSRISSAEDLPRDIARKWAQWARSPGYLLDDSDLPVDRIRQFAPPVLAYSFEDDDLAPAAAVDALMAAYPSVERRHVVPVDIGVKAIGHMGYFRKTSQPLWSDAANWLVV